jgi:hypothetical protein
MAAKLTRLSHKIAIHLQLVAESCTICSSHSRWPVRKLLDTPSYKPRQYVTRLCYKVKLCVRPGLWPVDRARCQIRALAQDSPEENS